jgi:hypothetical protein
MIFRPKFCGTFVLLHSLISHNVLVSLRQYCQHNLIVTRKHYVHTVKRTWTNKYNRPFHTGGLLASPNKTFTHGTYNARFWWESPKERDRWEDQGVGGKMGSEWILGRFGWGVWIGFDCLRTGTGGGLL